MTDFREVKLTLVLWYFKMLRCLRVDIALRASGCLVLECRAGSRPDLGALGIVTRVGEVSLGCGEKDEEGPGAII